MCDAPLEAAARSIVDGVRRLMRGAPDCDRRPQASSSACGFANALYAARKTTASLNRYPLVRWVNRLTGNRLPPRRSVYSSVPLDNCAAPAPLVPGDEVPSDPDSQLPSTFREDAVDAESADARHGREAGTRPTASAP